jgi:hypothetical protein
VESLNFPKYESSQIRLRRRARPVNTALGERDVTENMRKKTPQEKKQLSYEKDRRNCYGESPHGARKSIPKRKRLRNRANRKYQEQQLAITSLKLDDDLAEQIDSRLYQKAPKVWSKVADAPLKKVIGHKLQRRLGLEKQGGRRAAKKKSEDKS